MLHKGKIGEIYNICGKEKISVGGFLKKLLSFSKKKIECKLDKNLVRPKDIDLQISDSKKFHQFFLFLQLTNKPP